QSLSICFRALYHAETSSVLFTATRTPCRCLKSHPPQLIGNSQIIWRATQKSKEMKR
ncbi:unnamed protein product, partial [Musa banksii]